MRVLAVGAHFDDVELGCGGTIARHTATGDDVTIYIVTNSDFTNYAQEVIRKPEIALEEGRMAAKILGVDNLICGDYPTNDLKWNDDLARSIIKIIEENDIEIVYTHWSGDIHVDHQVVARATIAAARHVPRLLMYRSNYYESDVLFAGRFYVDITSTLEQKKRAIMAHESEYKRVGKKWLRFFENQNQNDGQMIGVDFAERFEILKYLK